MKKIAIAFLAAAMAMACGKKKEEKTKVGTKMRSTGISDEFLELSTRKLAEKAGLTATIVASSAIDVESLKVPVGRVNLVSDLKGSGYASASPDFYTCPNATAADCLVDLANSELDNLLANGGAGEITFSGSTTYDGVAVEFCVPGDTTFPQKIKGTVTLGNTLYYTNATSGLSATGPAEEATIESECHGYTTPLPSSLTVEEGDDVNIVLWADPNGMMVATTDRVLSNGDCTGADNLALCLGFASIFTTVDTAKPTIERYRFTVTTPSSSSAPYAPIITTLLFNSADEPIGATMQEIFSNTEEERLMHAPQIALNRVKKNDDGTITFQAWVGEGDSMALEDVLILPREDKTGLTISEFVDKEVTFNSDKL